MVISHDDYCAQILVLNENTVLARRTIYNSFVSSNFNYCPFVWHFCGVTDGNEIEKKYKNGVYE